MANSSNAQTAFVLDEDSKTITITQPDFHLNTQSILAGYHHIIWATTIWIDEDISAPGLNISLTAAQIVVRDSGAIIDTTGSAGKDGTSPQSPDAIGVKPGSVDGNDGHDGQDGADGQKGGNLNIYAAEITGGPLKFIGMGGAGGMAQKGGDGVDGTAPADAKDANFPKKVQVGTKTVAVHSRYVQVPVYGWGDDVKVIGSDSFTKASLLMAFQAEKGHRGGRGGAAGLAGKPGNGGDGGSLAVMTLRRRSAEIPYQIGGGVAGASAKNGTPGKAGKAGRGGRFLFNASIGFVSIDWSVYERKGKWKEHWHGSKHFENLGVDKKLLTADGKGLIDRAPSGAAGAPGGWGKDGLAKSPTPAKAKLGKGGQSGMVQASANSKPRTDIPMSYLIDLQRSVTIAIANRDTDLAGVILEWLLFLTSPYAVLPKNPSQEQTARNRIYRDAGQSVLTLGRDEKMVEKANIYSDISEYAAFVEGSITHLRQQASHLAQFNEATQTGMIDLNSLKQAIKETETYQRHLMGSVSQAGSIMFLRARENSLKDSIGKLDVDIFNLRIRLSQMEDELRSGIERKFQEDNKITLSMVLDITMMAVGIGMSLYTFGTSLASVATQVKKFYIEKHDINNWTGIIKEGIWTSTFVELKADLSPFMATDEWKAMTKEVAPLVKKVVDFAGKVEAYSEIMNNRSKLKTDLVDIQASVLTFDIAKLELRRQRAQLEFDLHKLLDDFKEARDWKAVFENFFHTCNTRFDNLAHLAELQAARREAEFQLGVSERNEAALKAQLALKTFNPSSVDAQTTLQSMMSGHALAVDQGLQRVLDMARAYRAWSLESYPLPPIPQNLTADDLNNRFLQPLLTEIRLRQSSMARRAEQDMPAQFVPRSLFPQDKQEFERACFDSDLGAWRFNFSIPLGQDPNAFHVRLRDVRAYPLGLGIAANSEIYCLLIHHGASEFLDIHKEPVHTLQVPRRITYSYRLAPDNTREIEYPGVVRTKFDEIGTNQIRYSPYATWELQVFPNHKVLADGQVYNRGLDWSAFDGIELVYSAYFNDRTATR